MHQVLKHEASYLEGVPSASMYERSFMHRDTVTHVAVAASCDMLLTGSADGHLKFWKKRSSGVEFVKHFRAHKGPIDGGLTAAPLPACTSCSSENIIHLRLRCALHHSLSCSP
jgi:peptidylprolyl isomerase domain and WD repeat-containing protein 1